MAELPAAVDKSTIFIVSDSLGEIAEHVFKAAAVQFSDERFKIVKAGKVRTEKQLQRVIEKAKKGSSVIFYTLVDPDLRELLEREADDNSIPRVDILGPALDALEIIAENPPDLRPGVWRELNHRYFRKIEALEFAVKNDDGRNPAAWKNADFVLVGVSRTSKTPLAMYLAFKGYKVGNVPVVMGIEPPKELYEVPKEKVIGLTIAPNLLLEVRKRRSKLLKLPNSEYAKIKGILDELDYAESIMAKIGCRKIDVTQKAIEETAEEILNLNFKEV